MSWKTGKIMVREIGRPPEQADLVYSHRPLDELPGIVAMAKEIGARAVWCQPGLAAPGTKDPAGCWVPDDASREARRQVESACLRYIQEPYIADTARQLGIDQERRI